MTRPSIEQQYLDAQRRFVGLARELSLRDWATPVPCCPGWTVRDVLSHVSGIPDDAMAGRLGGAATDPWTAAQVERNRGFSVDQLLERWDDQAPLFAAAIESSGETRPPIDCHSHEHDIRHALGRPGDRVNSIVQHAARRLVEPMTGPFSLSIELSDGGAVTGSRPSADGGPTVTLRGVTSFEIFRSRLGRRTLGQVEAYDWSGPSDRIAAVMGDWFEFGPSDVVIVE